MEQRRAAAACLIAAGAAVCVIAVLRTMDALGANVPFEEWFWNATEFGRPVYVLYLVGGVMFGAGLSLAKRR